MIKTNDKNCIMILGVKFSLSSVVTARCALRKMYEKIFLDGATRLLLIRHYNTTLYLLDTVSNTDLNIRLARTGVA